MKKNLISVITLALCLVNLVLTAVMAIAIIPSAQKSDELISKVANAIDLELTTTDGSTTSPSLTADQITTVDLEDTMTINLKMDSDGVQHYAVLGVSIQLDTTNEDYETYSEEIANQTSLIKTTINDVVSKYTLDEIQNDKEAMQEDILENLRALYGGSTFIYKVGFYSETYQ